MGANYILVLYSLQRGCIRSIETHYNLFCGHTMLQSHYNAGKATKCDFFEKQAMERMLENVEKWWIFEVTHGDDKSKKFLGGNIPRNIINNFL